MEENLLSEAAQQGIWAFLFISLFVYQLKDSRYRETQLIHFIQEMSKNFETLAKQYERLAEDVQDIKCAVERSRP